MFYVDYDMWVDNDSNDGHVYYGVSVNDIFYDENYSSDVFYNCNDLPKLDDDVFLVYAVYSTGDSYKIEHGGNLYPICITKNKDYAEKIRKIVEESENENLRKIEIPTEDGGNVIIDTPWNDYFGYLNYVEIEQFKIKKRMFK